MQRPGADAAEQECGAELRLAAQHVLDVAVGAVEGEDPGQRAGVHHAGNGVVPGVLLGGGTGRIRVLRIGVLDHAVAGVSATHPRRLHPPVGRQVGRAEAHSLHARRRGGDLLEVDHALGGLEDRMDQDWAVDTGLGLELGEQAVDIVDVPGALHLGDHHHVELGPDLGDDRGDVVEHPWRLEPVDAGPKLRFPELDVAPDLHQAGAGRLLAVDRHGVLQIAEHDVHRGRDVGHLGEHLLVGEVEEMDHARGPDGDLPHGFGGVDREGLEEGAGVAHDGKPSGP